MDSSDMIEEEGVEILRSSTHEDDVIDVSSFNNETINKKQITVLISSGNFNHTQTANQNLALQLLTDLSLSYVTIDGMDVDLKEKRDALFEISGIRGNYPQLFLTTSNQGARKTMVATTFLGDYAWLENNSAALVDMVSPPLPPPQQRGGIEFDSRLSALSSEGESFGTGTSSNGKEYTEQEDPTLTPKATTNMKQQRQIIEINAAPERQVDWIPEEGTSQISDGSFSQAAVRGDDVTETSFTTMTTVGDGGGAAVLPFPLTVVDESGATADDTLANTSGVYVHVRPIAGRNKLPARSPRPPRRMRAVDWCPPQHQPPQQSSQLSFVYSDRTRMSNPSISGITPSVVTSRAVRMADDNTITTFATMTTMGDAGSILEEDTEDEERSSDEESVEGEEGDGVDTNDGDVPYEESMEEVEDGDGAVVDKIPKYSNKREMPISAATNQAVRAPDDQSMVTFATMTTIGDRGNSDVVDRLPSFTATKIGESVTTNETVQIVDHESVATWATMNTMKGQITGNVVDHVPSEEDQNEPSNPNAGTEPGASLSVRTSNAVQDERSIATFTTNVTALTERGIQEVVDKIPTFAGGSGMSVMSGVTNRAVRMNDDVSTASFATMTTVGDLTSLYEAEVVATDHDQRPRIFSENEYEFDELDRSVVDTIPEAASSVASGTTNHSVRTGEEASVTTFATMTTAGVDKVPSSNVISSAASIATNHAVRINDDQSVATWASMAASAIAGHVNEHVVDKTPALTGREESSIVSGTTNHAIKDREDQSVVTWNTMTTAGARAPAPFAVDRVPSNYNYSSVSISGDTDQAVRAPDDQSVVTFATMTTAGYGRENSNVVDNVPSFTERTGTSVVTSDTVLMGDNESVATWATMNTMKGQITGNVVDHVPSEEETAPEPSQSSAHTSSAVQDERSIATFTTNVTAFTERGIQEVVDKIPTFAGGSGVSVMSGVTNRAVRMNDDISTASFATMTTTGDPFPQDRVSNTLVDRIPSFANRASNTSVAGGTDAAVKVGDDLTAATFATLTTVGDATTQRLLHTYQNEDLTYSDHSGVDEVMSGSTASRPTTGILRESRHGIKRESSIYDGADDMPINAGESVSNAHVLRAITDLRFHVDYRIGELREVNRRDSERVLQIVQQEQARRTALEARLHSQLLMQSESMVALELKVLRLEAKIASRDSHRLHRHLSNGGVTMDRLPPIAATPSTPNQSDEEADSFEELDLTPRATRSSTTLGQLSHGGGNRGGPTNIAVVTRSGASVASAVTAMSFPDEGFSHMDHAMNDDGSEDGDVEDEGDDNDGSQSTPTQGSRNQISNLESILLNPIPAVGSNDQGISTRATRGDTDGNSSLPTSVTSTTMASTVVTATTRGDTSVGIARISTRASEEDALTENIEERNGNMSDDRPRSRSQSPLTVQSAATETFQSVASASAGPSILSTAAVAPARSFSTRRAHAALAAANAEGRSLANRVVSFTTNDLGAEQVEPPQENDGGGDSITMPDDLDNLSDIADVFSNSARAWREEYEARLDAIHKRLDSR